MTFEPIVNSDIESLHKLQPEKWTDIIPEFKFYINNGFCYPIKVEYNNEIAGIGCAILFESTCWIAHIIVAENHRRKGIGNKIVAQLLRIAKNNNINTCILSATDMGTPVYEKLGFKLISPYTYLKKEQQFDPQPSENITPIKNEHIQALLNMDKEATGENRTKLLEPFMHKAFVYEQNTKAQGFYLPELAEGLIIASTQKAGFELQKLKYQNIEKAVLPSENKAAIDFLKTIGFKEIKSSGTRMVYGPNVNWKPEMIYSRLGPNFG